MKYRRFIKLFCLAILFVVISCTANFAQTNTKQKPKADTKAVTKNAYARIWHGRTKDEKADEYYAYLMEAGIKKIQSIKGNLGVQVLRGSHDGITEFTVISYWESLEVIHNYAGEDITKTHNLPRDPEFLLELEPTVKTFEVVFEQRKK